MKSFTSRLAFVLSAVGIAAALRVPDSCGENPLELLNSTMVNGQELQIHQCKLDPKVAKAPKPEARSGLVRRDFGLCGAPCTTYCNSGSGGPDPNDCSTMASALAGEAPFVVNWGYASIWTYASCSVQQGDELASQQNIDYCYDYSNWAGVVNYLAWNCQGTTNDQGGSCHFYDSVDYSVIQVQHS